MNKYVCVNRDILLSPYLATMSTDRLTLPLIYLNTLLQKRDNLKSQFHWTCTFWTQKCVESQPI